MKKLFILLICALFLVSCSAKFVCRNGDQAAFNRDNYECIQQSRTPWSGGGGGLIGLAIMGIMAQSAQNAADNLYNICMAARGWNCSDK